MDSGNSGSMQSSSGGGDDQELDSRGESISSFFNAPHHFSAAPPPTPFIAHQTPNFFHPHNLNHDDLIWSPGLRSDHTIGNSSSSSSIPQPVPTTPFSGGSVAAAPPPQKNPKKRTRASRRAPTTVLTTDTTNFRQMVQEFTGIPAAPFSGGAPFSGRLDLFSAAPSLRSADNLGPLYPLRPAAHKLLSPFSSSSSPPPLLNSTMIDAIVPTTTITNPNNNNSLGASTSNNPNINLLSNQQQAMNEPMDFASLNGFLSRATAVRTDNDELSRWRGGETVRNKDGIRENMVDFDGNNINSGESQNYNLNLAEKGIENVASTAAEGTVATWICPSQ